MNQAHLKAAAGLVLAFCALSIGILIAAVIVNYVPWQEVGEALVAMART